MDTYQPKASVMLKYIFCVSVLSAAAGIAADGSLTVLVLVFLGLAAFMMILLDSFRSMRDNQRIILDEVRSLAADVERLRK